MSVVISCPESKYKKEERLKLLFDNLEAWVRSKALMKLCQLFGGDPQNLKDKEFHEVLQWLLNFSEVWNKRNKQKEIVERMFLENTEFMQLHEKDILSYVRELGLIGKVEIEEDKKDDIRYILPLGGARYTCLHRPLMAKKIIDKYEIKNATIVGLTVIRPLNQKEFEAARTYSEKAENEYELMCSGIEKAFNVNVYDESVVENENVFLSFANRGYKYENEMIYVVAAPSSDPNRRGTTVDTYEFFFNNFECNPGDKIVLVTSQIYTGVQLLQFIPYALEKGVNVEIVGVDDEISGTGLSKTVNYLQEIRGTIDLIYKFYMRYGAKENEIRTC